MYQIIGGEMEGYGIVDSIRVANFIPWVVIKGICDWGCGKTVATKKLQIPVALHAAQFLETSVSTLLNYFPTSSTSRQMLHPWEKLTDMNLSVDSLEFSLLIDQWEHSHEAHQLIVKGPECQTIDQEIAALKKKRATLLKTTKDRLDKASESLDAAWNYGSCSVSLPSGKHITRSFSSKCTLSQALIRNHVDEELMSHILFEARLPNPPIFKISNLSARLTRYTSVFPSQLDDDDEESEAEFTPPASPCSSSSSSSSSNPR